MKRAVPLLLAALSGCWMPAYVVGTSASEWYEIPPTTKPAADVVRYSRDILVRQGYRLLPSDAYTVLTDWDVHLSSHWREGFRTKVEVVVERDHDGRTVARVRSYREVNENALNPMMEKEATWGNASLDEKHKPKLGEPALRVRQLLKLKIEGAP
jgi:hypothetical protein